MKILIQKLPLDKNGDLIFDVDEARDIHNNAVEMLRRAIGVDVLTTFADVSVENMADKNSSSLTQDGLEKIERKVVIDHHRKAPDCIENTLLSFHEVYASSAAELVTEIIQYAADDIELKLIEAESLYGGIMIDTKDFTFKTGVRTFEAARNYSI